MFFLRGFNFLNWPPVDFSRGFNFENLSRKQFLSLRYLSNREQRTNIDVNYSSWSEKLLGVPQGSILGPPFLIFSWRLFFEVKDKILQVMQMIIRPLLRKILLMMLLHL